MNTTTALTQSLPFELGETRSHGGLTLVALFPLAEPTLDYIGLDEALARGLTVTETGEAGAVEALHVTNPLADRVLLYEGEELVGAKQNRIVRMTTLVEAGRSTVLPVHCVERGRWAWRSRRFTTAPHAAYPQLRRASRSGQSATWASLELKADLHEAHSPTGAQDAIYAHRAPSLDEYVGALPRLPGQAGVLVGIAGELVCLDYVSRPDVFADLYRFLDALSTSRSRLRPPTGTGTERRLVGRVVGSELSAYGEVVALSAFPA